MNEGRIEQVASPAELYDRPATRFVAGFIGTMNLLSGRVVGDGRVEVAGLTLNLPESRGMASGAAVTIGFRPEDLTLVEGNSAAPVVIRTTVFHGPSLRILGDLPDGAEVIIDVPRSGASALLDSSTARALALRPGATPVLIRDLS